MRVVSQFRSHSFDFDRTVFWTQSSCIYAKVGTESILIGRYATEERAAEVFEDIHKAYAPVCSFSNGLTEEQVAAMLQPSKNVAATHFLNTGSEMYLTTYDNYVYYMPEE